MSTDPTPAPSGLALPGGPSLPSNIPLEIANLPPDQIAAILRNIPEVFKGLADSELKDVAATLSQLSSNLPSLPSAGSSSNLFASSSSGLEPGPSSHPHGPPNLGNVAGVNGMDASQYTEEDSYRDEGDDEDGLSGENGTPGMGLTPVSSGRRGGRSSTMSNEDWTRQRKDNHKEVERRRRGNINDGINELGRIVPNGTGEKAKGAILQRAVQYIHHLKENEARNIEKWTLEKLLMDQAMGDLQAQLEEMRRHWEEERTARLRAENELEVLRGVTGQAAPGTMAAIKRKTPVDGAEDEGDEAKRQRTE